ncbi:MAG TPA: 50S ribosomal protein L21 [Caulobacteraceae bacterium]|nr:50S ribosomal protein L21 [Caulobacteraceae bacterium]
MYAVIRTGGKQYRVQPGDLLVVEKLDGEPGAAVAFGEVLMLGEGADVTVGAPLIAGASVAATLVETRKGDKIKIFKKTRRKGYRRTNGHRQFESVLRVTGIAGGGQEVKWDGEVDLTPLAVLNERARNLARGAEAARTRAAERAQRKALGAHAADGETAPKARPAAKVAPAKAPAPAKKASASKAAPKAKAAAKAEPKTAKAKAAPKAQAAAAKPAAKAKAAPKAPKK